MSGAIVAAALALAAAGPNDRSEQWIYRDVGGSVGPVATFLSWDYSTVILRAFCDAGRVAIDYAPPEALRMTGSLPSLVLLTDEAEFRLEVEWLPDGRLRGSIDPSPRLVSELTRGSELMLDAPSETEEPWYLGNPEALARVSADCAGRQ